MKNKTRVLVVGLGSIGARHSRLLSERTDVELLICDAVEENRAAAKSTFTAPPVAEHGDYAEALNENPDIVFLCVPNHLHVPMGLQAIQNGVDIFVEKPVSDKLEDARKLVDAAKTAGRFLQVGYMLRLDDGLHKLKKIVDEGGIGQLVGGRAMIGSYITLLNAKSPDRDTRPNSLIVDYTHELDFIRWFFGEVADVTAMSARLGDLELKPPPNIFQMILKMQSGALVQVHMDYVQFPQRRIFEIYGDRGTLSYDFMSGEMRHYHFQKEHQWDDISVPPMVSRWDDLFRLEHEAIITAQREGKPPVVSGEDGLLALKIAERAINAVR
ncbi:MAG: Gfo/Idh/MocA family oxidoreductase [Abditibacteriaceae bacterium]